MLIAHDAGLTGTRHISTGCTLTYHTSEGAYQLTLDNDGDPFVWTSNYQVISKVYLQKHSSLSRTYTSNKKDIKMVQTSMANKKFSED